MAKVIKNSIKETFQYKYYIFTKKNPAFYVGNYDLTPWPEKKLNMNLY